MFLTKPTYKKVPTTTAADVEENIVHWILHRKDHMLESFCVKDLSRPHGYRFKRAEDFTETIVTKQKVRGLLFKVTFVVKYCTKGWLDPLVFLFYREYITIDYQGHHFTYKSDGQLTRFVQAVKNGKTPDYR